MSQHKFSLTREGKMISVLAGWDRPLQQVFLCVESELPMPGNFDEMEEAAKDAFWKAYDKAHCILFDNLLTPLPHVDAIGEILRSLNIPYPLGFMAEIEMDRLVNAGNRVVDYGEIQVAVLPAVPGVVAGPEERG